MSSDADTTQLAEPVTEEDHQRGSESAPVTLVMYGDYECPDTRAAHPVLKRLQQHFGDDLRVVFRHFPRPEAHPHAEHLAFLSEAAADQGRFWELHDLLSESNEPLNEEAIAAYSSSLGLGGVHYEGGHPYADRIRQDIASGRRSGVTGTPAIFINGRRHNGSYDEHTLQEAIDLAR
ncbi:MAG TPA: DsbA family protein [Thermomicrobiaceae bacterium]|nr:DsbA family protein [Thermomicrobiaceae bacterium]